MGRLGVGMSMSAQQMEAEMARRQAIRESGYRFIPLRLNNRRYQMVQGAKILKAQKFLDPGTSMAKFIFEVAGGPLRFEPDPMRGGFFHEMVDDEDGWNRRFLASHWDARHWDIMDEKVAEEIRELADSMKKASDLKAVQAGPEKIEDVTKTEKTEGKVPAKKGNSKKAAKKTQEKSKEEPKEEKPKGNEQLSPGANTGLVTMEGESGNDY